MATGAKLDLKSTKLFSSCNAKMQFRKNVEGVGASKQPISYVDLFRVSDSNKINIFCKQVNAINKPVFEWLIK